MTTRFFVEYSDGADHEGTATFNTFADAKAFAQSASDMGYFTKVRMRKAHMVRASRRKSWFAEQMDTFEG